MSVAPADDGMPTAIRLHDAVLNSLACAQKYIESQTTCSPFGHRHKPVLSQSAVTSSPRRLQTTILAPEHRAQLTVSKTDELFTLVTP